MGWHRVEAVTSHHVREIVHEEYNFIHTDHGFLERGNLWSVMNLRSPKPGAIALTIASFQSGPGGVHYLVKHCGTAPHVYDVPDNILVAANLDRYDALANDDRAYATWLARVLYIRYLLSADGFDGVSFEEFHRSRGRQMHWWKP